MPVGVGGGRGTESGTKEDKWWSSMEFSLSASLINGMNVNLSPSFSLGRKTWVEEYLSSYCRDSQENGNQMVEAPSERGAMSKKGRPKDPHGKYGELVQIFITTTPGSGESCWSKIESVA